jgi:hypothetical protein
MLMLRSTLLLAIALTALPARAQSLHPFQDAWFWGAKTGAARIGTSSDPATTRPTIGVDWLITRSRGALNLFVDYTEFDLQGSISDPSAPGGRRNVNFSNLRRGGFSALAFPLQFLMLRPYGGIGLAMNVIGRASADTTGGAVTPGMVDAIEDARSRATVLWIAGTQVQFGRLAAFGQFTWVPPYREFLISDRSMQFLEFGLRYNVGSSVDRTGRKR